MCCGPIDNPRSCRRLMRSALPHAPGGPPRSAPLAAARDGAERHILPAPPPAPPVPHPRLRPLSPLLPPTPPPLPLHASLSFLSVSVAAPTCTTATPPASFASRSCSFSLS